MYLNIFFDDFCSLLVSLNGTDVTELAMNQYNSATNMTQQFNALATLSQNPGQVQDNALLDFYKEWQHDYLVNWLLLIELFFWQNNLNVPPK